MKKEYGLLVRPIVVLFFLVNILVVPFQQKFQAMNININVVIVANLILFAVSMVNIYFQLKSLRNPKLSSGAVIRGVMAGTFIKLFVLAGAVIIYLLAAGAGRSVNAVFVGMGLYIIYTWLEIKISLRLNPKK